MTKLLHHNLPQFKRNTFICHLDGSLVHFTITQNALRALKKEVCDLIQSVSPWTEHCEVCTEHQVPENSYCSAPSPAVTPTYTCWGKSDSKSYKWSILSHPDLHCKNNSVNLAHIQWHINCSCPYGLECAPGKLLAPCVDPGSLARG